MPEPESQALFHCWYHAAATRALQLLPRSGNLCDSLPERGMSTALIKHNSLCSTNLYLLDVAGKRNNTPQLQSNFNPKVVNLMLCSSCKLMFFSIITIFAHMKPLCLIMMFVFFVHYIDARKLKTLYRF